MFVTPTIIILQQFVIVMASVTAIIMGISTVAAYATEDKGNPSSSEDEDCSSDELPARIDGTIRCMEQGECYSYEFEGKEVKHCNFMTSSSDE